MPPLAGPYTAPGGIWAGKQWEEEMQGGVLLHQWLLAGWGCDDDGRNVGFGESLRLGRATCWVESIFLKVPGGAGSPPNAVAIS